MRLHYAALQALLCRLRRPVLMWKRHFADREWEEQLAHVPAAERPCDGGSLHSISSGPDKGRGWLYTQDAAPLVEGSKKASSRGGRRGGGNELHYSSLAIATGPAVWMKRYAFAGGHTDAIDQMPRGGVGAMVVVLNRPAEELSHLRTEISVPHRQSQEQPFSVTASPNTPPAMSAALSTPVRRVSSLPPPLRPVSHQQCRHASLIRRPKRPYTFTQLITLSDGSTFVHRTTNPVAVIKSTKDIRSSPLWNPSSQKLLNVEEDEAGRLRAFRARFGRGWDAESTAENEEVCGAFLFKGKRRPIPWP